MANLHRKIIGVAASAALAGTHVGAVANTRASDSGPLVFPVSPAQVGAFPYSSWLVPDDDEAVALWKWALGGTAGFLLLSAFFSNDPETPRRGPNNGSNGAN